MVFSLVFQESENNDPIYSLQEYLNRLATSRNQLYDNYYGQNFMVPDMLRDRRRSSAENNFQLRVRKRAGAQQFGMVSQKMPIITIFGHNHFKAKFY